MGEGVGDFIWEGLCHRGNYVVKKHQGRLCTPCKICGGDYVQIYKNKQGGFVRGDIVPYLIRKPTAE